MAHIELISASAGSGKTHRLSEALEQAVVSGQARPSAILATTFTRKAAAELRERVRARLLDAGRFEDASALCGARIGTVNAVAGSLVRDLAFELGLSPDLRVLDETQAALEVRRALSRVVLPEDEAELAELGARLSSADWTADVSRLVDAARQNLLGPEQLEACGQRSVDALLRHLGPAREPLAAAMVTAIDAALARLALAKDDTRTTRDALESLRSSRARLTAGERLEWARWHRLSRLAASKKVDALLEPVRALAARHIHDPAFRGDVTAATRRLFDVAARVLVAYRAHKRERGVMDFVDQEVLALEALRRPAVRARLADELDLVLVDEFQDTSPLQLALFLELSELSKRSIWVGDQKQAIYGFRGADPTLMDAAFERIARQREIETLSRSWRSRPPLVHLTSELFARAFARQNIPSGRVRLSPATAELPGLDACVEVWSLEEKKKELRAGALAEGVRQLLSEQTPVRDGDGVRPARGGDIAVLCRTNEDCQRAAAALAARGVRAVVPAPGLLGTAEGLLLVSGLRLFADPSDRLADAELSRMLRFADDPGGFLARVLAKPAGAAKDVLPATARLLEARRRRPTAGAIEAFDAVCLAINVHDQLLAWGDAEARLANLDALRALAVRYAETRQAAGAASSSAGLLAYFAELSENGTDDQAAAADSFAVTVTTWHGAKGLEWPIAIVCENDPLVPADAFGVQAVSGGILASHADPLSGRWIRYWPYPYHPNSVGTALERALDQADETREARERETRQQLRLLYVAWTRAKDRLILATCRGGLGAGALRLLAEDAAPPPLEQLSPGAAQLAHWADVSFPARHRLLHADDPPPMSLQPSSGHGAAAEQVHPAAFLDASALAAAGAVGAPILLGDRIEVRGEPEPEALGIALHGVLASDDPRWADDERRSLAEGVMRRWGVAGAIDVPSLLAASGRLRRWAELLSPLSAWRAEWPLFQRVEDGGVFRGTADLILEEEKTFYLVDHKSFAGDPDEAAEQARDHAGQLKAYVDTFAAATGKRCQGAFVHFPLLGRMVPVLLEAPGSDA